VYDNTVPEAVSGDAALVSKPLAIWIPGGGEGPR
jgi:hypothetical protein